MKVLSIKSARSVWLVPTSFINPHGASLKPVLNAFMKRYGFENYEAPDDEKKGHRFLGGAFTGSAGTPIEILLTVHDDGFVAENRSSTEDGDLFLEDALGCLASDFGLARYSDLPIKKVYASDVFFQLEKRPSALDTKLRPFAKQLAASLGSPQSGPFDVTRLSFGTDPGHSKPRAAFIFEREVGAPFDENRFYSYAPCQTEAHLKLLAALEKALLAR